MKRKTIKQELHESLQDRLGYGRSKHADKIADKIYIDSLDKDANIDKARLKEKYYFHDRSTYDSCVSTARNFIAWCNETGVTEKRLPVAEYARYIPTYIAARQGEVSPRTVAKERSQLSKVWLVNTDSIPIPTCHAESNKGRGRDPHYNMNTPEHQPATDFYSMIGARKSEYHFLSRQEFRAYKDQVKDIAGIDIRRNELGQCPNIYPVLNRNSGLIDKVIVIHAKHGKTNISEILPQHQQRVTQIFKSREYQRYMNPSDHCNVHACRRTYAQEMYTTYARDVNTLSTAELYICHDGSGRIFDKAAIARVAESLGHRPSDLFDTVHNYLR